MPLYHNVDNPDKYPVKLIVTREEVARFNAMHSDSPFNFNRHYWFEFDEDGDLIDTDAPNYCNGALLELMAEDCWNYHKHGVVEDWMIASH